MNRTSLSLFLSIFIHLAVVAIFLGFTLDEKITTTVKTKVISLSHIVIKKPKQNQKVKPKHKPQHLTKKIKPKSKSKKKIQKKQRKKSNISKKVQKSYLTQDISSTYITINKSKIYEAIQRAKRYPRMAKKLRIQGTVLVTFTLTTSKNTINIQTSGAKSILLKSARRTIIEASSSFPKPSQNITISVPISYKLR